MKKILAILVTVAFSFLLCSPFGAVYAAEDNAVAQFVADNHVLMARADGRVLGWGDNTFGQLGLGDSAQSSYSAPVEITFFQGKAKIRQIAAVKNTSFVLLTNGELYSTGAGNYGKHGQGNTNNQKSWARIGGSLTFKKLYTNGAADFALAEDYSGNLYGWGRNDSGQLGLGDMNDRTSPTLVKSSAQIKTLWLGESYAEYIDINNKLYYWGTFPNYEHGAYGNLYYEFNGNYYRYIYYNATTGSTTSIKEITYISSPPSLATCYYGGTNTDNTVTGSLKSNNQSMLVQSVYKYSNLDQVWAGTKHAMIMANGLLYGWGDSSKKQLTSISTNTPKLLTSVNALIDSKNAIDIQINDIYADRDTNYLTFTDGSVYVWGDNTYNKAGVSGSPISIDTPTQVTSLSGKNIIKIVSGRDTTYYITDEGDIYASGSNVGGVTGLGEDYADEATIDTPTKIGSLGYSDTVTPPSVDGLTISVPSQAEVNSTISVSWASVASADKYRLKRTVTLKEDAEAGTARDSGLDLQSMVSDFVTSFSTSSSAGSSETVYTGSQTAFTDTAGGDWDTVAYELVALNRIGDFSSPISSNAVTIIPAVVIPDPDPDPNPNPDPDPNPNPNPNPNPGGNVVIPPVNVTVNPPSVTVQSPDVRLTSPPVTVQSPDIRLTYPEVSTSAGTQLPSGSGASQSAASGWSLTPEQIASLSMLMGSNRNSGAPYVITVEPSAPQYVPQQSATQNNTLLYVMLFVLGTALVAICAFMAASHLFNKSSAELERVRYMLSDLAGVDD